ncbi:acyltransferase family protein [Rhodoferax sp.]|uniref:acyltransferase family protein n=1 Tax=Rhodoferax sp. TaxID=50421 RepID=UPI00374D7559
MRNVTIDNARSIGVFLIVLGHALGVSDQVILWIYSFHVPLFFFISGAVVKSKFLEASAKIAAAKLVQTLLIPYVFFWVIAYISWLPTYERSSNAVEYANYTMWTPFEGFFIATGKSLPMDPALWFFTALFFVIFGYWILRKFLSQNQCIIISLMTFFSERALINDSQNFLVCNLDIAACCLIFYVMGAVSRNFLDFLDTATENMTHLKIGMALIAVLTLVLVPLNGRIDINNRAFGNSALQFLINAFLGITVIIFTAKVIPRNRFLSIVSGNSLTVFALHMVTFRVFTSLSMTVMKIPRVALITWKATVAYVLWAFVMSLVTAAALKKWLPSAIGETRSQHHRPPARPS